jgi:histidinol-phosphate phosphatase family protein
VNNATIQDNKENNQFEHSGKKAIFLDRDGVINVNRHDYVKSWSEFEFLDDSKEGIKLINSSEYMLIIITNQSPIGRGIFTTNTLDQIHFKMLHELGKAGAYIDAIYYCPHKPDDGCECRKPKPGLILRAASDFCIDLKNSWMIGDSDTDIEAGKTAGCRTAKVNSDKTLLDIVKEILD